MALDEEVVLRIMGFVMFAGLVTSAVFVASGQRMLLGTMLTAPTMMIKRAMCVNAASGAKSGVPLIGDVAGFIAENACGG
jgi:uncharacterized membrane protein